MHRSRTRLPILALLLAACGIPEEQHKRVVGEHQRVVAELEKTTADLHASQEPVRELEAEVAELSNTDSGHWSRILDLNAKRQPLTVIAEIDEFIESWPRSEYLPEARALRIEAANMQAAELLTGAQKDIAQERLERAKVTLLQIQEKYPNAPARRLADGELHGLDAKIALARRRAVGNGAWNHSTETSPVDDSTNVQLWLPSPDTIPGRFGESVRPNLHVRCKERKTEVFVTWDVYLGIDSIDVLHRLDDRPASTQQWSISTDHTATFYRGSDVGFARELQRHNKLLLRVTPYGEKPVTATFYLSGLENAVEPLKEACRWN